jgi:hypothetical protein
MSLEYNLKPLYKPHTTTPKRLSSSIYASLLPSTDTPSSGQAPKRLKMDSLSSQPAALAINFDKGDSVTLIVGPEKHELLVHANYIVRSSKFFKTALKKEWREGQTRTISMPTDEYETVTDYMRFIYSDTLPEFQTQDAAGALPSHSAAKRFVPLAKLYVLGHRMMDDAVKNAVVREFHRICTQPFCMICFPGPETVNIIYDGTMEGDLVRSLLIDVYLCHGRDHQLSSSHDPGFLLPVSRILLGKAHNGVSSGSYRGKLPQVNNYLI